MTNMPVFDRNSVAQNILSAKATTNAAASAKGDFVKVLKQTTAAGKQDADAANKAKPVNVAKSKEPKDVSQNEKAAESTKTEEKAGNRDVGTQTEKTGTVETEETKDLPGDLEEDTEVLERAGGEMAAMLAAQMGIPRETVSEAMEELGMTEVSLLDPKNLKELMVHLTEGADDMSLLTDETFYQTVTEALNALENIRENLMEETGMSEEELKAALENALKTPDAKEDAILQEVQEIPKSQIPREVKREQNVPGINIPKPELTDKVRTDKVTSKAEPKDESKHESAGKDSESRFMEGNYQTGRAEINAQLQAVETESAFPMAETQDIMDQIMEYMKVSVKPEMTSVEMQLHPESLGTLHIQISNREGAVTAQFIAQNESVRAVLESQIMELKENLEQQGVKVEAVEVTIAQYSLERNPEGNGEASGQGGGKQKKGIRSLNLRELDPEEEEDLTEEERLTAQMMQSDGSTVNYMA